FHRRAEEHRFRIRWHGVDDAQCLEPLAEVAHAAVDLAKLLLAVGVFGILRAVAFGGRGGQRLDHLRPAHAPQFIQLGLEPRMALRGDQRGGLRRGWSPTPQAAYRSRTRRMSKGLSIGLPSVSSGTNASASTARNRSASSLLPGSRRMRRPSPSIDQVPWTTLLVPARSR